MSESFWDSMLHKVAPEAFMSNIEDDLNNNGYIIVFPTKYEMDGPIFTFPFLKSKVGNIQYDKTEYKYITPDGEKINHANKNRRDFIKVFLMLCAMNKSTDVLIINTDSKIVKGHRILFDTIGSKLQLCHEDICAWQIFINLPIELLGYGDTIDLSNYKYEDVYGLSYNPMTDEHLTNDQLIQINRFLDIIDASLGAEGTITLRSQLFTWKYGLFHAVARTEDGLLAWGKSIEYYKIRESIARILTESRSSVNAYGEDCSYGLTLAHITTTSDYDEIKKKYIEDVRAFFVIGIDNILTIKQLDAENTLSSFNAREGEVALRNGILLHHYIGENGEVLDEYGCAIVS